jgi:hypothetical protein
MGVAFVLAGSAACVVPRAAPRSLLDARAECTRAATGPAMEIDPAVVHGAEAALAEAELAWKRAPDDPSTAARALIALRKAQIAESVASTVVAHAEAREAEGLRQALLEARRREAQALRDYVIDKVEGVTETQPPDSDDPVR